MNERYVFGDIESATKAWLITSDIAPLVTAGNRIDIYMAMPLGSPVPSLILSRVGGGIAARSDLPVDKARMSFDCWGLTRSQAQQISARLVSELDMLASRGGYTVNGVSLMQADVTSWGWLPDPKADTPRYIVDALITALPAD